MSDRNAIASIITIGDELLIGQVIDTNSAWVAQQLNSIGIWVNRRIAVGDNWNDIWQTLDEEIKKVNVIIITGGLGPTSDDITKPLLCSYFGGKMVLNQEVLRHVRYLSEVIYKRPFIERNAKQAEVPDVCKVLPNSRGTAPGMWFEKENVVVISLPGVPYEMKGIFEDAVLPQLQTIFPKHHIVHRTLVTWGIGESFLAEKIKKWEEQLPSSIKLAYLPNYGLVRLRLSGSGIEGIKLNEQLNAEYEKLKVLIQDWLIAEGDVSVPEIIKNLLLQRKQTLSTVESCTGGYIAHVLTALPGISEIYKGSVISYANELKQNLLDVHSETLQITGAVSEETVSEMIKGGLKKMNTDYVIATSGIMGPDGGTTEKPVGTVWIGIGNKERMVCRKFQFRFDRTKNIEVTTLNALLLLRSFIIDGK